MPRFDEALIDLGKMIGLLDNSGVVQWTWFGAPDSKTLQGIQANRAQIGKIIRALRDKPQGPDAPFSTDQVWEQFEIAASVGLGFVWNTPPAQPLRIGFGAKADIPVGGQDIDLFALARLLAFNNGAVSAEFGQAMFGGSFPVPNFLSSASITGQVPPAQASPYPLDLTVNVADAAARSRSVSLAGNPALAWDAIRLAVFVLQAWIAKQAQGAPNDGFFGRLNRHLFPALGDPAGSIQAFPLVGEANMGTEPDYNPWRNSVLTLSGGASGALTFLWHVRALLTANESPDFFSGSVFFPLMGPVVAGNTPPTMANAQVGFAPGATGVWIGIVDVPAPVSLVLDIRSNGSVCPRITLGTFAADGVGRPSVPAGVGAFLAGLAPISIGNKQLSATPAGPTAFRVTLLEETPPATGIPGFDGPYKIELLVDDGQPVEFRAVTPFAPAGIALPPASGPAAAQSLLAAIVPWVLDALPTAANPAAKAIRDICAAALGGQQIDAASIVQTLAGAVGEIELEAGPVGVTLDMGPALTVAPKVTIGPIAPESLSSLGFSIGKFIVEASFALGGGNPVAGMKFAIVDFRLGEPGKGATGLAASLLPDLKEAKGFDLAVEWKNGAVSVTGGGKIPIQKAIGPLEIVALLVDVRKDSFAVGIDLFFALGPITVSVYELGVRYRYSDGNVQPFLHGLGLAMDLGPVKLAGMFLENNGDYVGGAVVSIVKYFELAAIGGYTQLQDGSTSLFIFASLVAPLGGPPWFFVTGVAGGFGYNRSLPPPGLLYDHPFIKVMKGDIVVSGDAVAALVSLAQYFAPSKGQHWIAAGLQFKCFGVIDGKVVVVIAFGHKFSFSLLGLASFGIKPIFFFEIGIEATANEEMFLLKAGLSPNSYVLHPDIFSVRGDFALGIWYGGPNRGDFVLSIGGFHPCFPVPAHYPQVARVGVKAVVYGFVHVSVEVFMAFTPQAIMAGASLSVWAEFAGIGAGLDVYIDIYMRWDPFYLQMRMGVCVWFQFFGRHEIGVDLEIHTPPFGGTATIDLALVSFDVSFGDDIVKNPTLRLHEFLTRQLGVPATAQGAGASLLAFNGDDQPGLLKLDFVYGRVDDKQQQQDDSRQEGLVDPVPVKPEFGFAVRTRLPLKEKDLDPNAGTPATLAAPVDLPLCGIKPASQLTVGSHPQARRERLADFFPAAQFGEEVKSAAADNQSARASVGKASGDPVVALTEGILFRYVARQQPVAPAELTAALVEDSEPEEEYPLPLGWPRPELQAFRLPKSALVFGGAPLAVQLAERAPLADRRQDALSAITKRKRLPLTVEMRSATLARSVVARRAKALTVATAAAGAITIGVPASPARRRELLGVQLRSAAPRSAMALGKKPLEELVPAVAMKQSRLTPAEGARGAFRGEAVVTTGSGTVFELGGDAGRGGRLRFRGRDVVRAIVLDSGGGPVSDTYARGTRVLDVPAEARRVVLLGEGVDAPVGQEFLEEAVGVEGDSTLVALSQSAFAAHGCVVRSLASMNLTASALDSVPGSRLLRDLSSALFHFPRPAPRASVVLRVSSRTADPGLATEQIRWRAVGAALRGTITILTPRGATFVMDLVDAKGPVAIEVDLGSDWKLEALVLVPLRARELAERLRNEPDADLVDDRIQPPAPSALAPVQQATTVFLEVVP